MTENKKIWISSPHMGGNEEKFVKEAFDTNWVAPLGPNVNDFENDLENYLGAQSHAGALSSGTAAIHLGLILLDVKAGDTVLCQSMTFLHQQILFYIRALHLYLLIVNSILGIFVQKRWRPLL